MSVRLAILDPHGREVAVLAHGELAAGPHVMSWDGRGAGSRSPAGLYFVRLSQAGRHADTRVTMLQ